MEKKWRVARYAHICDEDDYDIDYNFFWEEQFNTKEEAEKRAIELCREDTIYGFNKCIERTKKDLEKYVEKGMEVVRTMGLHTKNKILSLLFFK